MKKRVVLMLMSVIALNSCYYAQQVIDDAKESYKMSQSLKKDRGGAYKNEKYKEGVYEAIKDVAKRPINKKVQFEGITLIIPENTEINLDSWTLLDSKTGYGLPIGFSNYNGCKQKKIGDQIYSISYNNYISGVKEIGEKLMKINGFKNTCN